jgi:hypothetical protein
LTSCPLTTLNIPDKTTNHMKYSRFTIVRFVPIRYENLGEIPNISRTFNELVDKNKL